MQYIPLQTERMALDSAGNIECQTLPEDLEDLDSQWIVEHKCH